MEEKIKRRKKKYLKKSKNGTIFYINKYGKNWTNVEPFVCLYVKYNQFLIDRNGNYLRITEMNLQNYEYDAYLYEDLKEDIVSYDRLEKEIKYVYNRLFGHR